MSIPAGSGTGEANALASSDAYSGGALYIVRGVGGVPIGQEASHRWSFDGMRFRASDAAATTLGGAGGTYLPHTALERPEAVIAPSLQSLWVNYDTVNYNAAGYWKDRTGRVHLRGMVKGGAVGWPNAIFTLPAAYWPADTQIYSAMSNGAFGRLDVVGNSDPTYAGRVVLLTGSTAWVSLDGISFRP